jgi:hypothetical protein
MSSSAAGRIGGLTTAYKHPRKEYTRAGLLAMNSYEKREARYRRALGLSPEEPVEPADVERFVRAMAAKAGLASAKARRAKREGRAK